MTLMPHSFLYWYSATVNRVIDGDTLECLIDLGMGIYKLERIRLAEINAPEVRGIEKELGLICKEIVKSKLEESDYEITINTFKDKSGKFGRLIGVIFCKDICLNNWLLENDLVQEIR